MIVWQASVKDLSGNSVISFPVALEAAGGAIDKLFLGRLRSEFYMVEAHGDFVKFLGDPLPGRLSPDGELPVSVADIEILERGNVYDRQGSD